MNPPATQPGTIDRDTGLLMDAMRGLAAMVVMFTHAFDLAAAQLYGWAYAGTPEGWRWARASLGHGGFMVWCFFVISGVCMHASISRSLARGDFAWRSYAWARITRIYPLFLLGLALAVAAWLLHEEFSGDYHAAPWRELAATFFSLQILTTPFPAYETSWSLSCEMFYYALWPAALLLCGGRAPAAAALLLAGMAAVAGGILYLWMGMHRLETSAFVQGVWTLTVLLPVWVCGAWLADRWSRGKGRVGRKVWLFSILLCLLAEAALTVMKYRDAPAWAVHLTGWTAIPGLLLFLSGAQHLRLSTRAWAEPVCRWLGQFSFPCYILHMQLLLLLDHVAESLYGEYLRVHPVIHSLLEFGLLLGLLAWGGPRLERWLMKWRAEVLSGKWNILRRQTSQTARGQA